MNETLPTCPECSSEDTYGMGALFVCPECGHEWSSVPVETDEPGERVIKDGVDHDIDCKVDGVGPMQLKSSVVRKA